jgi:23S rRNA (uracil1939-C5)-methyltransferase
VTAVRGRAEDEAARLARTGDRFTRVLLDPPRTGAKATMPQLIALAAARIVYVSCDAATLARDAAVLAQGGYTLVSATPVDMMPHTDHVEIVLLATRE